MLFHIFVRIGSAAYDIFVSKYAPRFGNGHVIFTKVHAVRPDFPDQLHMVVNDEYGAAIIA